MTISRKMAQKLYRVSPDDPGKHVNCAFLISFDDYIDEQATHRVTALAPGDGWRLIECAISTTIARKKAPLPCDEKLPPAKMSAYRCPFYGYIMKNDPKCKLSRFCTSVLGRIQIRRPSKTASPALCLFTNFDHFGNLVGGGSFGMENNDFSIDFPGSGLYLVCRCPFHGYIGEEMLDDGWRLTECAISCLFFDDYIDEKRSRTWNTYF